MSNEIPNEAAMSSGEGPERPVRVTVDGGVAVVTLDRPHKRNAFDGEMGRLLGDAFRELDQDPAVRRGSGHDGPLDRPEDRGNGRGGGHSPHRAHVRWRRGRAAGAGSRSLPAAQVLPAALEIAGDIVVNVAPRSAAASKRLLWDTARQGLDPETVAAQETTIHRDLMGGPDAREGVQAYLERRAPRWRHG